MGHAAGQYLTDLFWFSMLPPVLVALLAGDKAVDRAAQVARGGLGLGQLIHEIAVIDRAGCRQLAGRRGWTGEPDNPAAPVRVGRWSSLTTGSGRGRSAHPEFSIFTFEPLDGVGLGSGRDGRSPSWRCSDGGGGCLGVQLAGEGIDGPVFELFPLLGLDGLVVGGLEVALQVETLPSQPWRQSRADQPQPAKATARASSNQVRGGRAAGYATSATSFTG